jgi:predicted ABC-type ATPase
MTKPAIIMVAGPNGAGKSTIASGLVPKALGVVEYVNADVIARGISGFDPDGAALSAGRIMLDRISELCAERRSFAFETTGASRTFASRIREMKILGYYFLLAFVWVNTVDISLERVAGRVALGGHDVPEATIRRRYARGLVNFFDLYRPLADQWRFLDNSAPGNAILVAEGEGSGRESVYGANAWQFVIQMAISARTRR